jgi:hypothetical protein
MAAERLRLELLDSSIEIRARDARALEAIGAALGAAPASSAEPALALDVECVDGTFTVDLRRGSWDGLELPPLDGPEAVVTALVLWAARHSRRFRVVHAGAVALDGAGVLLPAPSHHGKSTLTAALVQREFGFLSDEIGALDVQTMKLHPFGRELLLRTHSLPALGLPSDLGRAWNGGNARLVTARELGGVRAAGPAELRLVVFLHYQAGAALAAKPLDARTALRWLFRLMPDQPHLGRPGFEAGVRLVQERTCWRLRYSELEPAVAALRDLLLREDARDPR